MLKRLLLLVCIVMVVIISGCIDSTTIIAVKKDGSGLVMETVYMNMAIGEMMEQMMGGLADTKEEEGEKTDKSTMPIEIDKYTEKALKMGEGVKFVSAKEVTNEDGTPGVQVVYSFEDIRKLRVHSDPESPASDQMTGMMPVAEESKKESDPITFDFIEGSTPKLIIQLPEEGKVDPTGDKPEKVSKPSDMDMGQMAFMKQFLAGLRIRAMVKIVDGTIIKTNASYVDKIKGSQYVTLFDMNMGELLNTEDYLKKLESMEQISDINAARTLLKDIPGFKIEAENRIEIEFR